VRLRDPDQVADEIADLRRERGVRVIVVQDDLFLLPNEAQSVARMNALGGALRRRGVDDLLFWIKGRPDDVTDAVLEAARRMGAIHLFLGVEHAVDERLRYLGRTHRPEDNRRALALCRQHALRASFNVMLFDPDCSLADVAAAIHFSEENVDATWNIWRTEIYSGTRLCAELAAGGRLEGSFRGYDYRMRDRRAELAFRMLRSCLRERCFACDSVVNRVISLSFARQVHRALWPGPDADALSDRVDRLCAEVYESTIALLRHVVDYAAHADLASPGAIHEHTAELALGVLAEDAELSARAADGWQRLTARGRTLASMGAAAVQHG
jgi:phage tail protein X